MGEPYSAVKKLGSGGNISLPEDILEAFGWKTGEEIEIEVLDIQLKTILIRQLRQRCSLCLQPGGDLKPIASGWICSDCRSAVRDDREK